jgi:hypothetical protein
MEEALFSMILVSRHKATLCHNVKDHNLNLKLIC